MTSFGLSLELNISGQWKEQRGLGCVANGPMIAKLVVVENQVLRAPKIIRSTEPTSIT